MAERVLSGAERFAQNQVYTELQSIYGQGRTLRGSRADEPSKFEVKGTKVPISPILHNCYDKLACKQSKCLYDGNADAA